MSDEQDRLGYLSATELRPLFASGELSPVEVLEAQITRIDAYNGLVNAISYRDFDAARAAAKTSEARYRRGEARALEGITVALKDEDGLPGWPMTAGSALMAGNTLTTATPCVDFLRAAGAVFHIQTTVPELYIIPLTWSKLFGVTRNPWNLSCTVGGSSGGSGATLAAGMTTLATGSDMGGSIRIPSAFNGTYGFKPPHGRVPLVPGGEVMPQGTSGPMARTLADLALLQTVMTGPHREQMTALRPALEYPSEYTGITGWRIAYSPGQGWARLDPEVRANTEAALRVLESQGAIIEEVDLGWDGAHIQEAITKALTSSMMGALLQGVAASGQRTAMTTYANYYLDNAMGEAGPVPLTEAAAAAAHMHTGYQKLFESGFKALVCPGVTTAKVPADLDFTTDTLQVDGQDVDPMTGWQLTAAFNLMYTIPVLSVPTGVDATNHVPTGMQITAQAFDDLAAFQVAAAYSAAAQPMFTGDLMPDFRVS